MDEHLYGLEDLLDEFVPGLVGMKRGTRGRAGFTYPRGAPVVQVVGARGSGKSALLHVLERSYDDRLPLACKDLAALEPADTGTSTGTGTGTEGDANASPVVLLLHGLAHELDSPGSRHHSLKFPRLSLGLLVVTAWHPLDAEGNPRQQVRQSGLAEAEADLRRLVADEASEHRIKAAFETWLGVLEPLLPSVFAGLPVLGSAAEAGSRAARHLLLRRRPDKAALAWWNWNLRDRRGDPLRRLFRFVLDLQASGDRTTAENLLTAAFLADINAAYGRAMIFDRAPPPLILLDNLHTALGRRFLDALLRAYDTAYDAPGPERPPVRPVVVGTALGGGDGHGGGDGLPSTLEVTAPDLWEDTGDGSPARWLLRLRIPPLDQAKVSDMLPAVDRARRPLPGAVTRLSAGRAYSAHVLVEAAEDHLGHHRALRPEALLTLPARGHGPGTTVAAHLLEHLVPDPGLRERLPLYALALDPECAARLWEVAHPEDGAEETAVLLAAAAEYVGQAHWHHSPWPGSGADVPFVRDLALRELLLHTLTVTCDDGMWARLHRRARAGYDPLGRSPYAPEQDSRYLHHTLALGLTGSVVAWLHHRFTQRRARDWLADLQFVCAAPRPREGYVPPSPEASGEPPPCAACATGGGSPGSPSGPGGPGGGATHDPLTAHNAIADLVDVLWRLSSLAAEPTQGELGRITSALASLRYGGYGGSGGGPRPGRYGEGGGLAFPDVAGRWTRALRDGARVPGLPIPGGEDA
ncbi:hypothetical protein [Streptomyces daliensis]|uniref:Uncharacterized protein n=1 Tax=Streptomyces daliensis TaxID=299421 RepID=A0A8T4IJH4_9ACTN|nr:hypothetical protein [Streptomyces daliensis]